MTLAEFHAATEGMAPSTPIHILSPWGEFSPAIIATIEDLAAEDPARETFPPDSIVIDACSLQN